MQSGDDCEGACHAFPCCCTGLRYPEASSCGFGDIKGLIHPRVRPHGTDSHRHKARQSSYPSWELNSTRFNIFFTFIAPQNLHAVGRSLLWRRQTIQPTGPDHGRFREAVGTVQVLRVRIDVGSCLMRYILPAIVHAGPSKRSFED
jgi:hypothetical protein